MSEFEGKVAIVIGASSAIGRSTAELLVCRGAVAMVMAAEAILFLASDRSRPINGRNLHVYSS